MPRIDQKKFYDAALKKYGESAGGVAWSDEYRQRRRFAALLARVPDLSASTVVDAGCGLGDLWLFMRAENLAPKGYIGIDVHEAMVKKARERTGRTVLRRDLLKDPLPEADWYLASGTFNLLTRFETILALKRCLDASSCGIVFNLLKGRDRSDAFNYWLPQEIKKACRSFGKVTIYEGYLEGDFTVRVTL